MKNPPDEFDERLVVSELAASWRFEAAAVAYADVGFGGYHWVATDPGSRRVFVTVDDLARKPWLGDTRESAFAGLRSAFDAAAALRDAGLAFVVAPIRTAAGETLRRVGPRHSLAVFPFVEGAVGGFGDAVPPGCGALLADLHGATETVVELVRESDRGPSARELAAPHSEAGPFAEPARRLLAEHESEIARLVAEVERLGDEVAASGAPRCVTHGEPHAGNFIATPSGPALVDWDTVALAPPERDLWMLPPGEVERYVEATGHAVDTAALELYRLSWDVNDLAAYVSAFRSPHRETDDTRAEYEHLARLLQSLCSPGG